MKETWDEYVDRVIRAKHLFLGKLVGYYFWHGSCKGYEFSLEFLKENDPAWNQIGYMSNYCRRKALVEKTKALIAQDKVLTYREDELY